MLFSSSPLLASSGTDRQAPAKLPLLAASQAKVMIQVSSFSTRREAEKEVARLKSKGVEALIRYESVQGKGKWHRVYTGPFENQSQASEYARKLKSQKIISWYWIKSVSQPSTASRAIQSPQSSSRGPRKTGSASPPQLQKPPVQLGSSLDGDAAQEKGALQSNSPAPPVEDGQASLSPTVAVVAEVAAKDNGPVATDTTVRQQAPSPRLDTEEKLGWDTHLKSQTTLRALQRDTDDGKDSMVVPLYQYLQLHFEDAEAGGWAMHFYGWGRYDLADSSYFEDSAEGELVHGYLEYSKPYSALRLGLGRQRIFSGVTNESVDGLRVETGLGPNFSALVYGGLPAAFDGDGGVDGQSIYGGRLAHHVGLNYELGLSYQSLGIDGDDDIIKAGADLMVQVGSWLTFNGLSSYNLDSQDWREHNYSVNMQVDSWALEPSYQYFQYQDYFDVKNPNNSIFSFLKDSEETLAITGADLMWQSEGAVEVGLRGRSYTYDVRQESAQYVAGLLNINLSGGVQIGAELGRMDGETPENIYGLYRGYFFWQNPLNLAATGFLSGDALYVAYDAPVFGEDSSTQFSMGAGRTFLDNRLETKLSIIYSQDPFFESDFGGVLTFQIDY